MGLFNKSTPTPAATTTTPTVADAPVTPAKPLSAADSAFMAQQAKKSGGLFSSGAAAPLPLALAATEASAATMTADAATATIPLAPATGGSMFAGKSSASMPLAEPKPAVTAGPATTTMTPPPRASLVQPAPPTERQVYLGQLKVRLHQQLVDKLDVQNMRGMAPDIVRREVRALIADLCANEKGLLNSSEQTRLTDEVLDETFGLGPLETLLKEPTISDIMVNRFDRIYVEKKGRIELSDVRFRDNAHLRQIIDRIVGLVGRRIDETSPMADARLADGSRVNAIIPPLALDGCAMSIRRFGAKPMQLEDLLRAGAFPGPFMDFLSAAVQSRANVIISGGTGSGKTTLLNCLSRYIPADERVITIEDAAELQLQQPHVVRLETRPSNIEGKGEVTQRELVKNCLRMRPDRVIIGECRAGETLDMMQAMNTGHEGSMTTVHANTTRDAINRLEVLIMMAGFEIPTKAMRQMISSAVNIVVQANRVAGGRRKVTRISEITGMEGDQMQMHDIFGYEQSGVDAHGNATGHFYATGVRPRVMDRIESRGIRLPADTFVKRKFE